MAKASSDSLIEAFKNMTLLELSGFIREFKETFGVRAALLVPEPGPDQPPGPDDPGPAEDDQDEFDVIIDAAGDKKIQVIKEVRVLTRLGLKDAKDLVDRAPALVLEKAGREAADRARALLEAAGAAVTVR